MIQEISSMYDIYLIHTFPDHYIDAADGAEVCDVRPRPQPVVIRNLEKGVLNANPLIPTPTKKLKMIQ